MVSHFLVPRSGLPHRDHPDDPVHVVEPDLVEAGQHGGNRHRQPGPLERGHMVVPDTQRQRVARFLDGEPEPLREAPARSTGDGEVADVGAAEVVVARDGERVLGAGLQEPVRDDVQVPAVTETSDWNGTGGSNCTCSGPDRFSSAGL